MGTPHEPHADETDKSLARRLRTDQREPLARAKENLKDRLLKRITQEAIDELQDPGHLDTLAEAAPVDQLDAVKASVKQRWLADLRQQAGSEVEAEAETLAPPDEGALAAARTAYKTRVADDLRRTATEELRDEVDLLPAPDADAMALVREAYKARLADDLRREATDALHVDDVLEGVGEAMPEMMRTMIEAVKSRLAQDLVEQVVLDLTTDDAFTEQLAETALQHLAALPMLEAVKESVKTRLLDRLVHEAIAEIDDEAGALDAEVLDSFEAARPDPAAPDVADEESPPAASEPPATLEMDYWEQEDGHVEELLDAFEAPLEVPPAPLEEAAQEDPAEADDARPFSAPEASDAVGDAATEAGVGEPVPHPIWYLYGIFTSRPSERDVALPPEGMHPGSEVFLLAQNNLFAVVSQVPVDEYGEAARTINLLDTAWTASRTEAHEALVEQLAEHSTFLPVPFCTTYDREEDVREMLSDLAYQEELQRLRGKQQWEILLHRNRETLHQRVVEQSDAVQGLMAEIKSKPKGGTSSIKKKMVSTIQDEMAHLTDDCTRDVHEQLLAFANDADLGEPSVLPSDDIGEVILAAAYLVVEEEAPRFQHHVEKLRTKYAPLGFQLDVEGPGAPTRFAHFLTS